MFIRNNKSSRPFPCFWAIPVLLLLCPTLMAGQSAFRWSGQMSRPTAFPNDSVVLRLRMDIDSGHYVYRHMTSVKGIQDGHLAFGDPGFSPPVSKRDGLTGEIEEMYLDSFTVGVPVAVGASAEPGSLAFRVEARYQGCTQNLCYLPVTDTLSFHLRIAPGSVALATLPPPGPKPEGLAGYFAKGGFWALVVAFLGGLLTSLTPCVYPLIPVTVAIFGAHAARSRLRSFSLSLVYVAGMALVFSLLGFVAARTGAVFGQILGNAWVVVALAGVFGVFAVSLFGAFDFQLPAGIQTRINAVSGGGKGFWRTFFMGAVAGFIAAPCTGPSLAAILTYVARSGNEGFGFVMLLCFAFGLGLPFLLLGTFSSLVAARPKPGSWMESVKSVLGAAVLVVAVHILLGGFPALRQQIASSDTYLYSGILFGVAGLAMGAIHLSYHASALGVRIRKTVGIILLVLSAYAVMVAITGHPPAEPDEKTSDKVTQEVSWEKRLHAGLERARTEGRPAFVDYTAEWCIACKELDRYTFSDSLVAKNLMRFVCIKVDLTENTPENRELALAQGISGLPTLDFYDSAGEILHPKRILGFVDAKAFLAHIQDIK